MENKESNFVRKNWWLIAGLSLLTLALPFLIVFGIQEDPVDQPKASLKSRPPQVDHSTLLKGPFKSGQEVTRACLKCHPTSAKEVMKTTHWTWESDSVQLIGHDHKVTTGKKHGFNNFCISVAGGNWKKCTSCHIGYGWKDSTFDFNQEENVDCLACHEQSGQYSKGEAGKPKKGVNLTAAAKSVGRPTRQNCGSCHFKGGGGNAVKHGDLDQSILHPTEDLDIHMGRIGMHCIDCHTGTKHQMKGRSMSVNTTTENRASCTDCHAQNPHANERLDKHTQAISCQTCHIPAVALKTATKTDWDWSTAGQDLPQDQHKYMKIKGSFVYKKGLIPEYYWYNGESDLYFKGHPIDTLKETLINEPMGSINDAKAKIHPFKVHRGKQIYDKKHLYLLPPKTAGEGGYWKEFDWDKAARLGAKTAGLDYSGEYGFTSTTMFWPLDHMVAVKEKALQCVDCHSPQGRLDWKALGYPGDPMVTRNTREVTP